MLKNLSLILLVSILIPINLIAGDSPVEIRVFTVTPTPFKTGDTLSFTVEIENTSDSAYGSPRHFMKVSISIYKDEWKLENNLWYYEQDIGTYSLAPKERRTVRISQGWIVPKDLCAKQIIIIAGAPYSGDPDERANMVRRNFFSNCSFSPPSLPIPLEKINVKMRELLNKIKK